MENFVCSDQMRKKQSINYTALRQFLENKAVEKDRSPCEKVLGTNTKVHKFAQFFEEHALDLEVIATAKLVEWTSDPKNKFNYEERSAFMEGIGKIGAFFAECLAEREQERQENQLNVTSSIEGGAPPYFDTEGGI